MKLGENDSKRAKQHIGLTALPLFKQRKSKKKKHITLAQSLRNSNQGHEPIYRQEKSIFKKVRKDKIVSRSRSEHVKSTNVSIVQMPSKCKNRFINLDVGLVNDEEKDDTTIFTPLKSLLSSGCKTNIDISGQKNNYSETNSINHVKNDDSNVIISKVQNNVTNRTLKTIKKCSFGVCTSDGEITSANIYELNNSKCIIVLKPESYFYFIGVVELELVKGSVEVLGYNFHEKRKKLYIFSPLSSSYLFIKAISHQSMFEKVSLKSEKLQYLGLSQKSLGEILESGENCSIFILSRKKAHVSCSVWPLFFENYLSFSVFPLNSLKESEKENRPCHILECQAKDGCIQGNSYQGKKIVQLLEWLSIADKISNYDSPKVIMCGGKSVGKSTLLRYLTNKCLMKWSKVLVMDFDLGQCEFTVAGCISVTLVEEPVLGPNFTHLQEPVRSIFLGEVDVNKCPENYIEGCKSLINYAETNYSSIPWLINTMGFTKGFGVTLICGIIQNIRPTNVIQIESKNKNYNFPSLLEPGFVYSQNVGSFISGKDFEVYNFHILPSASEQQSSISHRQRNISPREARNLVTLSYLSNMLQSNMSLTEVTPYMINMERLDLKITSKCNLGKDQIAATMNGNLVALCSQNVNDVFPNCHGFGIVRGIDVKAGLMFLITPVSSHTLSKINCLIKGNVALPESLYYNHGHQVKGHIPYMAHTSGGSTALFAKRDYRILPVTRQSR